MSWKMIRVRERHDNADVREFEEAAMMAKEGLEVMCELAEEMKEQYGERRGGMSRRDYGERYGMRGDYGMRRGYGERTDEWDDYGERRRRDSRGRYL